MLADGSVKMEKEIRLVRWSTSTWKKEIEDGFCTKWTYDVYSGCCQQLVALSFLCSDAFVYMYSRPGRSRFAQSPGLTTEVRLGLY